MRHFADCQDGWCGACHQWFHIWPSLDTDHATECPICREPATTVIACGEATARRTGS